MLVDQVHRNTRIHNTPMEAFYKTGLVLSELGTAGRRLADMVWKRVSACSRSIRERSDLSDDILNGLREFEEVLTSEGFLFEQVFTMVEDLLDAETPGNREHFKAEISKEIEGLKVQLEFAQSVLSGL